MGSCASKDATATVAPASGGPAPGATKNTQSNKKEQIHHHHKGALFPSPACAFLPIRFALLCMMLCGIACKPTVCSVGAFVVHIIHISHVDTTLYPLRYCVCIFQNMRTERRLKRQPPASNEIQPTNIGNRRRSEDTIYRTILLNRHKDMPAAVAINGRCNRAIRQGHPPSIPHPRPMVPRTARTILVRFPVTRNTRIF